MPTVQSIRESLVAAARRYSRVAHEVEDLAHDLVVSTLRRGLALDDARVARSAHGAARRHGAFLARSAARRLTRDASAVREDAAIEADATSVETATPLSELSPVLQTTLLLLAAGLAKAELHVALGVTDAALRKRFQALRDRAPVARPEVARAPIPRRLRRAQVGALARLATRASDHRALATSDPDGHGLIFVEALTRGRGTATTE